MTTAAEIKHLQEHGLYSADNEHDACGVGFVAHIKGEKSHAIVLQGLKILENLDHRGAVGADKLMGDGAGILIQLPDLLYREEMAKQGVTLPPPGEYGVGMIFLPKEHASRQACEQEMERAIKAEGQVLLGWRDVPVNREMPMSPTVRAKEPLLRQVFIGRGNDVIVQDALERKLYVIRKTASASIQRLKLKHSKEYYVPSMSCRTVVYKGLLLADQVGTYYLDLQDKRCVSALGLVHQRFSTNTFPEWPLAHPYRYVAHNGEINTVKGNYNWMKAREGVMASPVLGADLQKLYPISFPGQSDTATFDNCLELLTMAGYPISQAVMMMIPEPWEQHATMDPRRRAFYEYHAAMLEPWDGPASIVFTDGRQIGATLDRNGLRPSRYCVTDDDLVVMAFRIRRAAGARAEDRAQVAPAARQDVPDRPRAGPHDRRRGSEEPRSPTASPTGSGSRACASSSTTSAGQPAARRPQRAGTGCRSRPTGQPARPPAGLRLHPGRHQVPDEPDGRRPARKASARWATTRRWRCCRTRTSRSTTTSSSCSRRSPTRRSIRSARRS